MTITNRSEVELLKETVSTIVIRYRGEKSLREFAADLSSTMVEPISYNTIRDWENRTFLPRYYTILPIALNYDDWRRKFALEILAVLKPELYQPDQPGTNP